MKDNFYTSYRVFGSFKRPGMKYRLKVLESFGELSDAKHFREMLERGGCDDTVISRVQKTPATETVTQLRRSKGGG